MTLVLGSLQLQASCISSRHVRKCQYDNLWQRKYSGNPKPKTSLSKLSLMTYSHFEEMYDSKLERQAPLDHPSHENHQSRVSCIQSMCLAKRLQCLKSISFCGYVLGGCLHMTTSPLRIRRRQNFLVVKESSKDDTFDDEIKPHREGELEFCTKRSISPKGSAEMVNESGYVIKVSKELMSVFQYVEKVKRARLKELSETLRQVAYACLFFSCVKGIVTPLVEVFKTQPPSWGKLIMVLGAFDAFAITYLALKASQPLERLSSLATECENERNMMGSIEKEEEYMLALALDLVRLFRRLRNLALCTAVTQFAHILHSMLQLQKSYPNFAIHITKFVNTWLSTPWV